MAPALGSFNTTITRNKSMEGSVTVADSITVPLSPDLTVDCVFSCLYVTERPETLKKTSFCSLNSVGNQKLVNKKNKNKEKQTPLKHAGYYFCFLLSHPLMFR